MWRTLGAGLLVLALLIGFVAPVGAASSPTGPTTIIVSIQADSPYWMPHETNQGITLDIVRSVSRGLVDQASIERRPNILRLSYRSAGEAAAAQQQLRANPDVTSAEPNHTRSLAWLPSDPDYVKSQWWMEQIQAPQAWSMSTGNPAVTVAVIDSGVSPSHPDLAGQLVAGYNAVDKSSNAADMNGHGTHVAGIIAAKTNTTGGVGVAMDVRIMPIRVVADNGDIDVFHEIDAIYWAVDNGADVINLSLGDETYVPSERQAIQYAVARGIVVVASGGNSFNKVSYPGNYDEVIAVGAMGPSGAPSSFTSRLTKVDIGAPGESIFSSGWDPFYGDYWDSIFYGGNKPVSGTSFSTAMVSAAAALLKSVDPAIQAETVRRLLTETAVDVGPTGREAGTGAGRLNIAGALAGSLSAATTDVWSRSDAPIAGQVVSRTWMWGNNMPDGPLVEPYVETQRGERFVRYYDKSRMEVTDPQMDRASTWYVTNGLLVSEMITGRLQLGDAEFEQRAPSRVNVAGDLDDTNGVTYASFAGTLGQQATGAGQTITTTLDRSGRVSMDSRLATYGVLGAEFVPETGHRIASVFWQFLNSRGLIADQGVLAEGQLFEPWFYATGLPITEAYWTQTKVAGELEEVLVQCFERRCLTYTPSNDEAWRVEMGNVGLHYYAWRYVQTASVQTRNAAGSTSIRGQLDSLLYPIGFID